MRGSRTRVKRKESVAGESNGPQQAAKGLLLLTSTRERFLVDSRDLMSTQTFKMTDLIPS